MKIIPSIVTLLFLIAAGTVSSPAQNATTVEPLLVYKALQDKDCRHWVDSVMDKLSFKEKVGQLFIYTIAPVDTKRNLELLREVIDTYKVGGLLFSGGKMQNQVELTNRAQRQAKVPLMITFDGEWGLAMRLRGMPVFPRNMVLGCIRDNKLLYEYGREVARQCRQIGVQVNFAPVADVNINPENPVINTRSFGEDPIQVADKVIAYASGLESGGVLSVCKHFPGHGDTDVDSHKALPVLPFTRERLDSVELYPFKEAIRAGLGGMMVGHLQVPVIAAGGISTGEDIAHFMELGASGVQMGSIFVTTLECDASETFKEVYIHSKSEDVLIIESPVGMPGRAIDGEFIHNVNNGLERPKSCSFHCIKTCDYTKSPYCIIKALYNAARGNMKKGYAFAGSNAFLAEKISSVKEVMATLEREFFLATHRLA